MLLRLRHAWRGEALSDASIPSLSFFCVRPVLQRGGSPRRFSQRAARRTERPVACRLSLPADGRRIRDRRRLEMAGNRLSYDPPAALALSVGRWRLHGRCSSHPRHPHLHDARPPAGRCTFGTGQPVRGEATIATKSGPGGPEAGHHQLERSSAWAASCGGPSRTRGHHLRRALPTRCHRQAVTRHTIGQGPCRRAAPMASRRAPERTGTPLTRVGGRLRPQRHPAGRPRFRQLRHHQPQARLGRRPGARRGGHRK